MIAACNSISLNILYIIGRTDQQVAVFFKFIYLFCLDADGVLGRVPQSILDDEDAQVLAAHENCLDLQNLKRISENAYKQYLKSRPNPSPESIKRVKTSDLSSIAVHPLLGL